MMKEGNFFWGIFLGGGGEFFYDGEFWRVGWGVYYIYDAPSLKPPLTVRLLFVMNDVSY